MSFYFGDVGHAAHTKTKVFTLERSRYASRDACLADARRTNEAKYLPLRRAFETAYCYEFLLEIKCYMRCVMANICNIYVITRILFLTSSIP